MVRLICPVEGCTKTFDSGDSLAGHVASQAEDDSGHREQRESPNHDPEWYENNCIDEDQTTLF